MTLVEEASILNECVVHAERCLTACLSLKGEDCKNCAKACRDTSDLCSLLKRLEARKSKLFDRMIPITIEVCKECMLSCDRMQGAVFVKCSNACAEAINQLRLKRK